MDIMDNIGWPSTGGTEVAIGPDDLPTVLRAALRELEMIDGFREDGAMSTESLVAEHRVTTLLDEIRWPD
jgi:hypothetical protein